VIGDGKQWHPGTTPEHVFEKSKSYEEYQATHVGDCDSRIFHLAVKKCRDGTAGGGTAGQKKFEFAKKKTVHRMRCTVSGAQL
jgi:hypothetical protein